MNVNVNLISPYFNFLYFFKEIAVVVRRFAEYESEQVPESASFQGWQTEIEEMEKWLETTKENCNQQSISKDSHVLKKEEKATKVRLDYWVYVSYIEFMFRKRPVPEYMQHPKLTFEPVAVPVYYYVYV